MQRIATAALIFFAVVTTMMAGNLIGNAETDLSQKSLLSALNDYYPSFAFAIVASILATFTSLLISSAEARRFLFLEIKDLFKVIGFTISTMIGLDAPRGARPISATDISELREFIESISTSGTVRENSLSAELERDLLSLVDKALGESLEKRIDLSLTSVVKGRAKNIALDQSVKNLQVTLEQVKRASSTVTIRGFLNLLLGIGFAFSALYFLKESIEIFKPSDFVSVTTGQISYMVGIRLSLTIVITAISYFFLSLYKKSLDETKYYQNEMTFLSGKISTILMAKSEVDKDLIIKIIDSLSDTDRNRLAAGDSKNQVDTPDYVGKLIDKLPTLKSG